MGVQVPVNKDPEKLGQGYGNVKPGSYHVALSNFLEYETKNGSHIAELEILAAPKGNEDQLGLTHKEFFSAQASDRNPDSMHWAERLLRLALVTGLVTEEQLRKHKEEGTAPDMAFEDVLGAQFFVDLIEEPRSDNSGRKDVKIGDFGFAMYAIHDERCKDFPCNQGMLKRAGLAGPGGSKNGTVDGGNRQGDAADLI